MDFFQQKQNHIVVKPVGRFTTKWHHPVQSHPPPKGFLYMLNVSWILLQIKIKN